MKAHTIFIIGRQRTGTTVFRRFLAAHGAFNAREVFHKELDQPNRFYSYVLERIKEDPALVHPQTHAELFGEYIEDLRKKQDGQTLIIDVKYWALNLIPSASDITNRRPFILRYIKSSGSHGFHVVRRNKLRIYVSEKIARATGKWTAGPREEIEARPPLILDPAKTVKAIKFLEDELIIAKSLLKGVNVDEVAYEDMFQDDGMFSQRMRSIVRNVLDVVEVNGQPSGKRMNPEPLSQLITNYDEVRAKLLGTEWSWMLEEK